MAISYPSSLLDTAPASERTTHAALRSLDDNWRLLHSVVWQGLRQGRQGDGEADFVLLHPRHGLLVLEVKGGRLQVEGGDWYSVDRYGDRHRIKNPFLQATDSKHSLLRHIEEKLPEVRGDVRMGHAVVFPDISADAGIGPYGPRALIIDRNDLRSIAETLQRICEHWALTATLTAVQVRAVVDALAPTVSFKPRLREHLREADASIRVFTDRQIEVFRQLRRMRRVTVLGGAGTGKTVLALERAKQLAAEHPTLLVCYNDPLAKHLSAEAAGISGLTISTFHSLCFRAAHSLKRVPRYPDETWWEKVGPDLLAEAAGAGLLDFGALVADEVQDFADEWLTALLLLLKDPDSSPCYLFGDTHQQLYRTAGKFGVEFPEYYLDVNCRNTFPIAGRVARLFGDPVPQAGPSGPSPTTITVRTRDELLESIQDLVTTLIEREEVAPADIVVLTDDAEVRRRLLSLLAGETPFVGLYERGVVAESVQRFKGLEASVVVLALSDGILRESTEKARALLYVGMSRARGALYVISSAAVKRQWWAS